MTNPDPTPPDATATPECDELVSEGRAHYMSLALARSLEKRLTAAKAEIAALRIEYESRADWIARMLKILGCENKDGFHCRDPHNVAQELVNERDHLRAQLRERTQWQCACGGTDCAGIKENERLRAEVERLGQKQPINTHVRLFDLVRFMRSELHRMELITDEEYVWLCADAPLATYKDGGSPSPRRLEDYDQLRARVADLENDLEKSKHDADDWHRAWETVTEQAKKEVAELEQDRARHLTILKEAHEKIQNYAKRQGKTRMAGKSFNEGTVRNTQAGQHYPAIQSLIGSINTALAAASGGKGAT